MNRRHALLTCGVAGLTALAGCLRDDVDVADEDKVDDLPRPVLGDPDSDIVVQAFEDYSCPHCATYEQDLFPAIKDSFIDTGDVRYEFYDWPIPVDNLSRPAANVARHVQDTVGEDAFWEFKRTVFNNQDQMSGEYFVDTAVDLGATEDDADYARHGVYDPVLDADREYGDSNGVAGTPTVIINGEIVSPLGYEGIETRIESLK